MDYRKWTENRDSIPTDAVGRDDAGQRRYDSSLQNYFHRHFVSI